MKRDFNQDAKDREDIDHKEDMDINQPEVNENVEVDNMTDDESDDDNEIESDDLNEKYEKLNDSYLRLNAEFDNFRKRTVKEKAEIIKSGGERVLTGIISLVDDFDRALDSIQETDEKDAIKEGMILIYTKFISFLKQNDVEEIKTIGETFDADLFEAVTTIPASDESQKGMVIDCIQKGYKLNDKIIRYPKVVVGE